MQPEICIYHAPCADGFGSAYALWRRFPGCQFVPAAYGNPPPDVTGKNVVIVDFSYKRDVLTELSFKAKSLLVIDHHKTARDDLSHLPPVLVDLPADGDPWTHFANHLQGVCASQNMPHVGAVFDMEKSGARLTWEFFHRDVPVPALLLHVEDRDLWRFSMRGTREVQAVVFSYPYDFNVWDGMVLDCDTVAGFESMVRQGAAIERKHHKDVKELLFQTRRSMVIGGYAVPVANMPYTMASDAAGILAIDHPFAATYYDALDGRRFSLRSRGDQAVDVSMIASQYGGGGHRNAAGFTAPAGWEGDL